MLEPKLESSGPQYGENDPRNAPLRQYATMRPWYRDIKPDDTEDWGKCHLLGLHDQGPLPLSDASARASYNRHKKDAQTEHGRFTSGTFAAVDRFGAHKSTRQTKEVFFEIPSAEDSSSQQLVLDTFPL